MLQSRYAPSGTVSWAPRVRPAYPPVTGHWLAKILGSGVWCALRLSLSLNARGPRQGATPGSGESGRIKKFEYCNPMFIGVPVCHK